MLDDPAEVSVAVLDAVLHDLHGRPGDAGLSVEAEDARGLVADEDPGHVGAEPAADELGEPVEHLGDLERLGEQAPRLHEALLLGGAAHHAFVEPRVLDGDRDLVGHDLQQLLLVGLRARRQHVARDHHAELPAAHVEGQRPLDLGPVVGRRGAGAGQDTARLRARLAVDRDVDAGRLAQLDAEAGRPDRLREAPQQLLEHPRHPHLGGDVLQRAVQVLELRGPPHEVLVQPLELFDLVEQTVDEPLVELAEIDALVAALDPLALAAQELGHLAREGVDVDGLLDVAVAAGHQRPLAVALHRVRRHRDDRGRGEVRERFQDRDDLVPVHARQVDVEQDQRRLFANRGLDPGQAVLGVHDRVAGRLQDGPHEHTVLAVVLDVEDLHLLVGWPSRHSARSPR